MKHVKAALRSAAPSTSSALDQSHPVIRDSSLLHRPVTGNPYYVSWIPGNRVKDVESHIQAYGCLMTDYTMLLRDHGVDVDVGDLYVAQYENYWEGRGEKKPFPTGDKPVDFPDLRFVATTVELATGRVGQPFIAHDERFAAGDPIVALRDALATHGSIAVHVVGETSDGHWVVVDAPLDDGRFKVRDPLHGRVETAAFGPDGTYRFNVDGQFKYVGPK